MGQLRTWIRDHRTLAMMLVAVALCVKALVPQGYMVGAGTKILSVQLCSDGIDHKSVQIALPTGGKAGGGERDQGAKGDGHCAFSSLTSGSLAGADALLLALALAFILALGFAPPQRVLRRPVFHLRPPLRGPPIAA